MVEKRQAVVAATEGGTTKYGKFVEMMDCNRNSNGACTRGAVGR